MTSPRGRLLLVAALLAGAVLAQAGQPAADRSSTSDSVRVARPAPKPVTTPGPGKRTPGKGTPDRRKHAPGGKHVPGSGKHVGGKKQRQGTTRKVIYLTFDDGPQREYTPKVLAVLARHHAKATFFMLGRETAPHPDLVAQVRRAGHTIGNHSYGHLILNKLSPARLRSELVRGPKSKCFRPPFRATSAQVHQAAAALGQREILWDIDTSDWSKPGAAKIERAILRGAHPGAIVLLHDGGGDRSQTVQALNRVLPKLAAKGYTFAAMDC
ncbi:polysaccharide deacetylase family protein [Kribbella deserti]|uniref:Polysaccharide deacetylase family protein n=1 Tax=Kribbella deserti TaxID=1926257 RepID=A0ABV6QH91_9ACTN